jgi:hypothetical protein
MAVVFDEVTADVQPVAADRTESPPARDAVGVMDPHELRREIERQAMRLARRTAD